MPVFRRNHDYRINIADLKRKFSLCPLELQLIWLVEILKNMSFIYYKELNLLGTFKTNIDNNYVLSDRTVVDFLYLKDINIECFNVLLMFRNKYVHSGALEAYKEYKDLMTIYRNELCELGEFAGVELSINFIIYKELLSKKV